MKTLILSYLNKYKWTIVFWTIMLVSIISNICLIKSCSNLKDVNNNNIVALTDTIKYYQGKNGELVASKTLLEGDLNTLKLANDSLYKKIKSMKISDPATVVYVSGIIDNTPKDTTWKIAESDYRTIIDSLNNVIIQTRLLNIKKEFAFNDEYRSLEGNVEVNDTTVGLNIEKDQIMFDYTLAVEDNKVYITSDNPYVKYNKITGITLPKPKKYRISVGVGPQIGYGYDFINKRGTPYVGIGFSLNYNLFQFWAK